MLYLASASPRRRELLTQIQVPFRVLAVSINEQPLPQETPDIYVQRLAQEKALAGWQQVQPTDVILAADTSVILNQQILGKPENTAEARAMLQALAGKTHEVLTGITVINATFQATRLNRSQVTFAPLTPAEINAYISTQEGMDKAGSYAIQGLASIFITHLHGSYSGVMGLPLYETAQLLAKAGIPVIQQWQHLTTIR